MTARSAAFADGGIRLSSWRSIVGTNNIVALAVMRAYKQQSFSPRACRVTSGSCSGEDDANGEGREDDANGEGREHGAESEHQ